MRKIRFLLRLILLISLSIADICVSAQKQFPNNAFSVSAFAGVQGYNSGIGIELGTPSVLKARICFRIKGNISWLEQYKAIYDHWANYKSLTGSIVYNSFITEQGRIYFEIGPQIILPDQKFSALKSIPGITSSTGVELFLSRGSNLNASYYFSGGISYIKAYAEKMEYAPHYGNGFVFTNGFRFYF